MKTVTFAKLFRYRVPTGHWDYPAGATLSVSDEVARLAEKKGALAPEKAKDKE